MDLLLIIGYINKTPQKFLFWDVDVHPVTLKNMLEVEILQHIIHCMSPDHNETIYKKVKHIL